MYYVAALLFAFALIPVSGQTPELPSHLRGYKVYKDTILVKSGGSAGKEDTGDAFVRVGEPSLIDIGMSGVTFELSCEARSMKQSGKVDFLVFKDLRVNGIAVEVEDYEYPFSFTKGETVVLPKPARILLPTSGILRTAWKEMRESKKEWTVTGRVFVFGRFRRYGFLHKRVVPVDIDIKIPNPTDGVVQKSVSTH